MFSKSSVNLWFLFSRFLFQVSFRIRMRLMLGGPAATSLNFNPLKQTLRRFGDMANAKRQTRRVCRSPRPGSSISSSLLTSSMYIGIDVEGGLVNLRGTIRWRGFRIRRRFSHQLFENIFDGDHAGRAVFVHHDGKCSVCFWNSWSRSQGLLSGTKWIRDGHGSFPISSADPGIDQANDVNRPCTPADANGLRCGWRPAPSSGRRRR